MVERGSTRRRTRTTRQRVLLGLGLALAGALTVTGCSAPQPPEVSFFADGNTVNAEPIAYCDELVSECTRGAHDAATLNARQGKPVQISLPAEIAETPWLVNIQYLGPDGQPRPIKQEVFTPDSRHAYTATPQNPGDQMLVVEIQQLGAAYATDDTGNLALDEEGNPQLKVRAFWSLKINTV